MNFGTARKKAGIFVYDLPLLSGWHSKTELKPIKGKTFQYFGHNWWDLMDSNLLQKSKYIGIGSLKLDIDNSESPGYVIINCCGDNISITNKTNGDVYNVTGYSRKMFNPVGKSNSLFSSYNKCMMQNVQVGDANYILIGLEKILNGTAEVTMTPLYTDLLLASGIVNSEQYFSTTGLNAYIDKAYRAKSGIEIDEGSMMMDFVEKVAERWESINPATRSPKGESIPHKIHWIWLSKVPGSPNPLKSKYTKFMKTWIDRNPNSEFFLWTDSSDPNISKSIADKVQIMDEDSIYDVLEQLPNESRDGIINMFENHPNVGSRADSLRQAILYTIGGVYADVNDMACLIPMEPYMDHFDFMAGLEPMMYANNAFVASAPGHPIVRNFLQFIAESSDDFIDDWDPDMDTEEKDDLVVSQTGPVAFSSVINGVINNDEDVLPRTCIFPSKFIYSNYEISESPLSWLSFLSLTAHFDARDYLK
jgi:mannosyltransferase OCH1-like enzyme